MRIYLVLIAGLFSVQVLWAQAPHTSNLPQDVQDILKRKASCGVFGGEEGYDDEKRKEVEGALENKECTGLGKEITKLESKYKGNAEVLDALKAKNPKAKP